MYCSHMGHLAGALAGLMVGLVALENRKVSSLPKVTSGFDSTLIKI